ncbi:MAG: hypothetical protein ACOYL6_15945 [Bacteriovoracaceae bacterium]
MYGKNGHLQKSIRFNPHLKNIHHIHPGEKIFFEPERVFAVDEAPPALPVEVVDKTEEREVSPIKNIPYSDYAFFPAFYYSTLEGKDLSNSSQAELISKINFLLQGSWRQNWSKKWATSIEASFRREEYYATNSVPIENRSLLQGSFGVGSRYQFNQTWSFLSQINYSQETFYRASSLNSLVLESVALPKLAAGFGVLLFSLYQYRLDLKTVGMVSAPSSSGVYNIKTGKGYKVSLGLEEELLEHKKTFACEIFFASLKHNSGLVDQSKNEAGMGCLLSWRLGEGAR